MDINPINTAIANLAACQQDFHTAFTASLAALTTALHDFQTQSNSRFEALEARVAKIEVTTTPHLDSQIVTAIQPPKPKTDPAAIHPPSTDQQPPPKSPTQVSVPKFLPIPVIVPPPSEPKVPPDRELHCSIAVVPSTNQSRPKSIPDVAEFSISAEDNTTALLVSASSSSTASSSSKSGSTSSSLPATASDPAPATSSRYTQRPSPNRSPESYQISSLLRPDRDSYRSAAVRRYSSPDRDPYSSDVRLSEPRRCDFATAHRQIRHPRSDTVPPSFSSSSSTHRHCSRHSPAAARRQPPFSDHLQVTANAVAGRKRGSPSAFSHYKPFGLHASQMTYGLHLGPVQEVPLHIYAHGHSASQDFGPSDYCSTWTPRPVNEYSTLYRRSPDRR